ncbi:hypothetical protein DTO96_102290 [Ephemeroptericola cinctiostellae]|uniref:N-acetyltransferase domain-containing protein n=1 Tax=Ephemeroptericola cinctiostellae TaxID=2268024 RepID=A0A345DDU7_9BURK|nr:GNAT family N-acetyltransferase [Ephemeroptericola cinctiostellae]AXF86535.1 hypothetical protein DTO96_102290 [Ephemeroptericola cinctiostellae]
MPNIQTIIRHATAKDAAAISSLILSVAHFFTLHPQGHGAEVFLNNLQPDAILKLIEADHFLYCVAHVDGVLAGAAAMKDNAHLYHLFVSPAFQKKGIARQLWQHMQQTATQQGNQGVFTVNSTPYAQSMYEHFGFCATAPRVQMKGIAFIPMSLNLHALINH